jgi:hypothetical protein
LISQPVAAEQVLMRVNALNEKLSLAETPTMQLKALAIGKAV